MSDNNLPRFSVLTRQTTSNSHSIIFMKEFPLLNIQHDKKFHTKIFHPEYYTYKYL